MTQSGTCSKIKTIEKKKIICSLPKNLLSHSTNYKVKQNLLDKSELKHVYSCHSAGQCKRKIEQFNVYSDGEDCTCKIRLSNDVEACCCPTIEKQLSNATDNKQIDNINIENKNKSNWVFVRCDADKGLMIHQIINWNLEHGKCWPLKRKKITPVGRFFV